VLPSEAIAAQQHQQYWLQLPPGWIRCSDVEGKWSFATLRYEQAFNLRYV
jgi:hypothetical protein